MDVKQAIENLYLTFAKYTPANMEHCNCGCIDEEDVKKLASKKLRELEEDDFASYHGSAMYTWGELEHYKHFLPRMLEVHHEKRGKGFIGLFEFIQKFEHAKWEAWDEDEVKAIKDFIAADWYTYVNERYSDIGTSDLEEYSFFLSSETLFKNWKIIEKENGLKNFVNFFFYNGSQLIDKGLKLKNNAFDKELRTFIYSNKLLERLEQAFFIASEGNSKYAATISTVLQMIEQERAISKA